MTIKTGSAEDAKPKKKERQMKAERRNRIMGATMAVFTMALLGGSLGAEARINKADRVLVVVSELQAHGPANLRDLYRATEEATIQGVETILRDDYNAIYNIRREQATLNNFASTLRSISKSSSVKAIDVIFSLHGSTNAVAFREGTVTMADLKNRLLLETAAFPKAFVNRMKSKLRVMYNLSCFGKSHNNDFLPVGFDVSVGSVGINANAAAEFPSVLGLWSVGWEFQDAFGPTNNDVVLAASDSPARLIGINANSKKEFLGNGSIKIDSDPL